VELLIRCIIQLQRIHLFHLLNCNTVSVIPKRELEFTAAA